MTCWLSPACAASPGTCRRCRAGAARAGPSARRRGPRTPGSRPRASTRSRPGRAAADHPGRLGQVRRARHVRDQPAGPDQPGRRVEEFALQRHQVRDVGWAAVASGPPAAGAARRGRCRARPASPGRTTRPAARGRGRRRCAPAPAGPGPSAGPGRRGAGRSPPRPPRRRAPRPARRAGPPCRPGRRPGRASRGRARSAEPSRGRSRPAASPRPGRPPGRPRRPGSRPDRRPRGRPRTASTARGMPPDASTSSSRSIRPGLATRCTAGGSSSARRAAFQLVVRAPVAERVVQGADDPPRMRHGHGQVARAGPAFGRGPAGRSRCPGPRRRSAAAPR